MKSATFPSLRVDPTLRQAAEDVLQDGEPLSAFVEHAVRAQIALRQSQEAFIARGLASRDQDKASGRYVTSAGRGLSPAMQFFKNSGQARFSVGTT